MIKLKKVKINKYKSFLEEQEIEIEDGVTRIVGKNESGKTALLEAISKFNYFDSTDDKFKFNEPIRLVGVTLQNLKSKEETQFQMSLFNYQTYEEENKTKLIINDLNRKMKKDVFKRASEVKK